ncbi:MAG: polysaccharide deacetylase family protein [Firmicutes bacterium]|nr:polysaccharide deacetylase family protein [Bacillota bacterium]
MGKLKGIIAVFVVIALAIGGYFIIRNMFQSDGYDDEGSFEKYANEYYASFEGEQQIGTSEPKFEFGQPVSIAIDKPSMEESMENSEIDAVFKGKKDSFTVENKSLGEEQQAALLMGYESYETPEKAESVAIHERQILNAGKEEQKIEVDKVTTFNFSTENGVAMVPTNIFKGDYKKVVIEKIKEQVEESYKDKVDDMDLTKFVMTGDGFRFFADGGVLAEATAGVQHFDISYDDMEKFMRDNIGENVIDPNKPMVAVTYDDGPSDGTQTKQLLDLYEQENAVCTFFELGANVANIEGSDELLKRELEIGCEVGTHSWDHPNLFTLSDDAVKQQAQKSIDAIEKASGQKPTVFRAPYGNGNDKISKIFGLPGINWTVDTLDWQSRNADSVVNVVKSFGNLDGQIILMHSIYQSSVDASKVLVPWLKSKGYQLVTVSDLLRIKYKKNIENKYYGYTFAE